MALRAVSYEHSSSWASGKPVIFPAGSLPMNHMEIDGELDRSHPSRGEEPTARSDPVLTLHDRGVLCGVM